MIEYYLRSIYGQQLDRRKYVKYIRFSNSLILRYKKFKNKKSSKRVLNYCLVLDVGFSNYKIK